MKELNYLPYARNIFGIDDMAVATLGSGLISGIGSLFGGKSASDKNLQAQRETNRMQMEMFQKQLDYNRAAEDRARQYALEDYEMNSPAAQRARWEAAGMNPALMMGENAAGQIRESTAGSSAPSAPQLGAPVQQDYITPAMQQMVNGMIGFSQAQKNAEEAAGIASDTRVKAATEQLRIKQAFQENQKRIYELRSMKHLPKIKEMELKNLQEQNRILQDTNAVLDMTQDARVKAQQTQNYMQDRLAFKYNEEALAQQISNRFAVSRELLGIKELQGKINVLGKTAAELMSRVGLNKSMAAYQTLKTVADGIVPGTKEWNRAQKAIENALELESKELGDYEANWWNRTLSGYVPFASGMGQSAINYKSASRFVKP